MIILNISDRIWRNKHIFFGLLFLLLLHIKFTYSLDFIIDVDGWDETSYLNRGINFSFLNIQSDGWVYYLWYKILSLFISDNIQLYILNRSLLLGLSAYLMFLVFAKIKVNTLIAISMSAIFMVSNINAEVWPYITQFALGIVLITILGSLLSKKWAIKLSVMTTGSLLLMYTRPEYSLAFCLLFLVSFIYLVTKAATRNNDKSETIILSTALAILVVVISIVGSPLASGRGMLAFGQHFSLNYTAWAQLNIDPWIYWEKIVSDVLKTDDSILKAMINNPSAVMKHVGMNLRNLYAKLFIVLLPYNLHNELIIKILKAIERLFLLLVFVYMGKKLWEFIKKGRQKIELKNMELIYFSLLLIIPAVLSIIIIYPRQHYLLIPTALIYITSIYMLNQLVNKIKWPLVNVLIIKSVFLLCLVIIYYFVPFLVTGKTGILPYGFTNIHMENVCTLINRINRVKAINITKKVVFLSALGYLEPYFPDNYRFITPVEKNIKMNAFIQRENINMIYINKELENSLRFKDDSEFQYLLLNYSEIGYKKRDIVGCDEYLLVK